MARHPRLSAASAKLRLFLWAVCICGLAWFPPRLGAQQQFSGKTVLSVSYQPEKQPIDPRDLAKMQLVQADQPLSLPQVATTIDNLFASGLYDDIQVDAEPSGAGVRIRFITRARLFVGHVDTRGKISNPPNAAVITSDSQLYLGTPYNPKDVQTALDDIRQLLRSNGLYGGDAGAATITDRNDNQVTVRFLVNSGKRARYSMPVIEGDPKLPTSAIVRATGWRIPLIRRWRQVTESLTDRGTDGIQKKYAKKDRLTADIDVKSLDYDSRTNRVKPTLDLNAGPRIQLKALEAKLKKKKLQTFVPIYQEGAVDNDLLVEGARNISDYFQAKGYPDVDVTFKAEPVKDDVEAINYYIALGPRRRLVNVSITGSNYFTPETLQERMFLRPASFLMRYGRYSDQYRKTDEGAIESLYQANGFQNVKVTSAVQADYKGKPKDIAVTYHIDTGPQWLVSSLNIEGVHQLDLTPIHDQLYSVEGQPYAAVNVTSDRNRILEYYYEHGFLHATFAFKAAPGPDPNTMALTYYITEGQQEYVRSVLVSGLERTHPQLVDKLITLHDGDPISMSQINNITRKLSDLGIFSTVTNGLQDPDGTAQYKYVLYDMDEAARYSFNLGLGLEVGQFGNTTNNVANANGVKGISPLVSFDVNRTNFLGRGQTLSLQTRYSTLEQRESLNYIVPRFLGSQNRTVTFSLLYDTTQNVQTFSSRREQASVQTSQRFNRASTLLLRFDYRRVSTSSIEIPALIIPLYSQAVRIGMLSASYVQDHRDNPADAHRGFWNTLDVGVAGGFFGSQRNFARVLARNATYTQIGRNLVLARQTQIGAILPWNVPVGTTTFDDIPLPERFFGGGGVSMRGFNDNQAGPRDIGTASETPGTPATPQATGFPIGGNGLFFNTVELRFPLLGPNISGVFFEDMGNIFNNFSDITAAYHQPNVTNFNYSVQAPGFGIRYKTPLGPIRVDIAYALNPPRYTGYSANLTTQQLLACNPNPAFAGTNPGYCTPGPQTLSHINFFFSIGQAF